MSIPLQWEPLPARRSKDISETRPRNIARVDSTKPKEDNVNHNFKTNSKLKNIEANINERAARHRAENTLESKDGCAGEFYECIYRSFYLIVLL